MLNKNLFYRHHGDISAHFSAHDTQYRYASGITAEYIASLSDKEKMVVAKTLYELDEEIDKTNSDLPPKPEGQPFSISSPYQEDHWPQYSANSEVIIPLIQWWYVRTHTTHKRP